MDPFDTSDEKLEDGLGFDDTVDTVDSSDSLDDENLVEKIEREIGNLEHEVGTDTMDELSSSLSGTTSGDDGVMDASLTKLIKNTERLLEDVADNTVMYSGLEDVSEVSSSAVSSPSRPPLSTSTGVVSTTFPPGTSSTTSGSSLSMSVTALSSLEILQRHIGDRSGPSSSLYEEDSLDGSSFHGGSRQRPQPIVGNYSLNPDASPLDASRQAYEEAEYRTLRKRVEDLDAMTGNGRFDLDGDDDEGDDENEERKTREEGTSKQQPPAALVLPRSPSGSSSAQYKRSSRSMVSYSPKRPSPSASPSNPNSSKQPKKGSESKRSTSDGDPLDRFSLSGKEEKSNEEDSDSEHRNTKHTSKQNKVETHKSDGDESDAEAEDGDSSRDSVADSDSLADQQHESEWNRDLASERAKNRALSRPQSWMEVDRILTERGFPGLSRDFDDSHRFSGSDELLRVVSSLIEEMNSQARVLESRQFASDSHYVEEQNEAQVRALEKEVKVLRKKLSRALFELETGSVEKKESQSSLEAKLAEQKVAMGRLRQRLAQAQHGVREKNKEIDKLREKLESEQQKWNRKQESGKKVFAKLQKRPARKTSAADSQTLDVISVLSAEKEESRDEVKFLRSEVKRLNQQLRDHENEQLDRTRTKVGNVSSSSMDASESMREESFQEYMGRLKTQRQQREIDEIRHDFMKREAEMLSELKAVHSEAANFKSRTRALEDENENFRSELESRPTVVDWRKAQQEIYTLEQKLSKTKSLKEMQKYMDTRELVRRDKDLHSLGLHGLEHLPKDIATNILQDLCRDLSLSDVALLRPTLKKMTAVVNSVPSMDRFIRSVIQTVSSVAQKVGSSHIKEDTPHSRITVERVTAALKEWETLLEMYPYLDEFKRRVRDSLQRRCEAAKPKDGSKTILAQLEDVVANETELMQSQDTYKATDEYVRSHPEALSSKIIRHFMHLFDVAHMDGVLPRMSSLFQFEQEMKNNIKALRSTLGLDHRASVNQCLAEVESLVKESRTVHMPPPSDENAGGVGANGSALPSASSKRVDDGVGLQRAVAERAVEQLKRLFDVRDANQAVMISEKLLEKVRMYDDIFPRLDDVITQLYTILNVRSIHDVVPAVERLAFPPSSRRGASQSYSHDAQTRSKYMLPSSRYSDDDSSSQVSTSDGVYSVADSSQ